MRQRRVTTNTGHDGSMTPPVITVMITTHNRVRELVKTLENCTQQIGPRKEILVVDDTSTDRTFDMVRTQFPAVNIVRNPINRGSIASRNDILRRAKGRYVVALDDDSRFVDNNAFERIVAKMDTEPDLGIISFRVVGPEKIGSTDSQAEGATEWHCSSFACCGAVIRRAMLTETGLFPEFFYHAYEEPDLASAPGTPDIACSNGMILWCTTSSRGLIETSSGHTVGTLATKPVALSCVIPGVGSFQRW